MGPWKIAGQPPMRGIMRKIKETYGYDSPTPQVINVTSFSRPFPLVGGGATPTKEEGPVNEVGDK